MFGSFTRQQIREDLVVTKPLICPGLIVNEMDTTVVMKIGWHGRLISRLWSEALR